MDSFTKAYIQEQTRLQKYGYKNFYILEVILILVPRLTGRQQQPLGRRTAGDVKGEAI